MVELRLGKINEKRKFIPTKKEFFEEYLHGLKEIEEYEVIETLKEGYKYRCYNDHDHLKFTKNKRIRKITSVIKIDEKTFNKVLHKNNKYIRIDRKYYHDGKFKINVDYFTEPLNLILVKVTAIQKESLKNYKPPKGFVEVTGNEIYENSNIYNGSIISNNTIIEGSDGVGKSTTIEALLKEGIICQDRCMEVISANMLFNISMEERAKKYQDYLKSIDKNVIILVNNNKEELERRINSRTNLSEFDKQAYDYNILYLETFKFMKKHNMLMNKMFLVDTTNLSIEEQTKRVKEIILCQDITYI